MDTNTKVKLAAGANANQTAASKASVQKVAAAARSTGAKVPPQPAKGKK